MRGATQNREWWYLEVDRGEDAAWRGEDEQAFAVGRGPVAVFEVQDLERVGNVADATTRVRRPAVDPVICGHPPASNVTHEGTDDMTCQTVHSSASLSCLTAAAPAISRAPVRIDIAGILRRMQPRRQRYRGSLRIGGYSVYQFSPARPTGTPETYHPIFLPRLRAARVNSRPAGCGSADGFGQNQAIGTDGRGARLAPVE